MEKSTTFNDGLILANEVKSMVDGKKFQKKTNYVTHLDSRLYVNSGPIGPLFITMPTVTYCTINAASFLP